MRTKKIDAIQYVFIAVIILLTVLFVYIIFFLMPESAVVENRSVNIVTDTVDYQDYVFQQKLVQLYQDVANTQHNHYTWLLVFFLGFVAIMLLIFISTINKLLNFIIKGKSNNDDANGNNYMSKRLEELEKLVKDKHNL